jgi:pimeloyl-ACP methyl ester carboxylesterase
LIHGLGGNCHSFDNIIDQLAAKREVISIDLPGFGLTPPLKGKVTISALADSVTKFLVENNLVGIDAVGSSMGARLVLELVRRNVLGHAVSLNPGGFWEGWERHAFFASIFASGRLVRALQPVMPTLTHNPAGRLALFSQFSAHPAKLDPEITLQEMRSYAQAKSFNELLWQLSYGDTQEGLPRKGLKKRLVIGWGAKDRVTLPIQAERALEKFPDAKLQWFEDCGHFPHWDAPLETVKLILKTTQVSPKKEIKPLASMQKARMPIHAPSPSQLAH